MSNQSSNNNLIDQSKREQSPQKLQDNNRSDKDNTKYPICFQCKNRIKEKQCVILGQKKYHIEHFRCNKCNQKLANKLFYEYHNKIYCEDDYKTQISPICHQCNNFITGKYISGKNVSFHIECFVCSKCHIAIEEKQEFFFSADKIHLYCKKCKKKCSEVCAKCKKQIQDNEQLINGKYYHTDCLKCEMCRGTTTTLQQQNFVLHNNMIVHDTCILTCHHCSQVIEDEKQITHYFDYILHSRCATAYANFIRQNTINAFKRQNSNQNKINHSLTQSQLQQQQQQQEQQTQQCQQQSQQQSQQYQKQNTSSMDDISFESQIESKFSNSIDQLNKQFSEIKFQEVNFDTQMEFGSISKEKLDNIYSKQTYSIDSKQSEEEQSPKSKIDQLFSQPISKDKKICLEGINISANQQDKNKKKKNKKRIEVINSESDENYSD